LTFIDELQLITVSPFWRTTINACKYAQILLMKAQLWELV